MNKNDELARLFTRFREIIATLDVKVRELSFPNISDEKENNALQP